jgi:uncharacterized YigZ family protein
MLQMTNLTYRTIAGPAEGQYREKGSRFLAFAYPVVTDAAIRQHVHEVQKKYFDARHHCFAWILQPEGKLFRAFDDGEPTHSAGEPILGQIRSRNLTDVLVLVVRYFGGVKLGMGGLAAAYKSAAADALNNAMIVENEVTAAVKIQYGYEATAEVMRLVKEFDLTIRARSFEVQCMLEGEYRLRDKQRLLEKMETLKAMGSNLRYEIVSLNEDAGRRE